MRPAASSKGSERKLAPMTVSSPNVTEIKLDRLIDDMRLLRSQMIAFDRHLKEIARTTSVCRPPATMRSRFVVASPARTSSTSMSTEMPWARRL